MKAGLSGALAVGVAALFSMNVAFAGVVPCTTNVNAVTPNLGCQFTTTNNDPRPPETVNGLGFFGHSDWLSDGKTDSGPAPTLSAFSAGMGKGGTWTLNVSASITDLFVLLKGPNGQGMYGYQLIKDGLVSALIGSWTTPFGEFRGGGPQGPQFRAQDVSHISVYFRESAVNAPATLALLGAGLAGLAALRRRTRRV